jgi:hypothetical protein
MFSRTEVRTSNSPGTSFVVISRKVIDQIQDHNQKSFGVIQKLSYGWLDKRYLQDEMHLRSPELPDSLPELRPAAGRFPWAG